MIKEASLEMNQKGDLLFRTTEDRVAHSKGWKVVKPYQVHKYVNVTLMAKSQERPLLETLTADAADLLHPMSFASIHLDMRTPFDIKSLKLPVVDQIKALLASHKPTDYFLGINFPQKMVRTTA